MSGDLPTECRECEKTLSPNQREDSYHATFQLGEGGFVFCRKHLDQWRRNELSA